MVAYVLRLRRPLGLAVLPVLLIVLTTRAQPVTQPFTFSMVPHTLPLVTHGTTALGDVDNDGDLDVYLSGLEDDRIVTALYSNAGVQVQDGSPTFVFEETGTAFAPLLFGSAAWGDYDGDGDLDLITTGSRTAHPPYDPISVLYRNDAGQLTALQVDFKGFHSGVAKWADYDNDGDLDLLIGGVGRDGLSGTLVYRNDDAEFVADEPGLPGTAYGSAAFADADNDGDLDLALSGISGAGPHADVFVNENGTFSPLNAALHPASFCSLDWGDFDSDGDLDLLQSGGRLSARVLDGLTYVYRNSDLEFDSLSIDLPAALSGTATWGDYDNDGDLDLFVMGARDAYGPRTAEVFRNEGAELIRKIYLVGVIFGSGEWGDVDGDGDLDLVTSGRPTQEVPLLNLYENRRQVVDPPSAPFELASKIEADGVELRWMDSADEPATYNLRVGTEPGAGDVVAPMAEPVSGARLLAARGNAGHTRAWMLRGLPPGTYYWSVQALDHAYFGSRFAQEQSFTVSEATASSDPDGGSALETELHPLAPNPTAGPLTVRYDIQRPSRVVIRVHDVLGREVATLVDRMHDPGRHRAVWDGRSSGGAALSSGLYFCIFDSGDHRETAAFVVSK